MTYQKTRLYRKRNIQLTNSGPFGSEANARRINPTCSAGLLRLPSKTPGNKNGQKLLAH